MPRDERVLHAAKRLIHCWKKNIHQDDLTDMAIRRQKRNVNAVHFVKNLNHVDLGYRVSGLVDKSFGEIDDDDYDIDSDIDF